MCPRRSPARGSKSTCAGSSILESSDAASVALQILVVSMTSTNKHFLEPGMLTTLLEGAPTKGELDVTNSRSD